MADGNDAKRAVMTAQVVALSMIGLTPIYAGLGIALVLGKLGVKMNLTPLTGPAGQWLSLALLVAGGGVVCASFVIRRAMAAQARGGADAIQQRMRIAIVGLAIAEAAALMGLVLAVLTSELTFPCLLWGISLLASLAHFPSRAWLEGTPGGETSDG
jgi:F0F1-type ATP synthase membrane subunit c/vacuolar-type H+-ATPase subunit K